MCNEIPSSFGEKTALFTIVLSLLLLSGCLGLKSSKREPDNDAKDCVGVSCWTPPKNACSADDELQVYAPSGHCSGGECSYATRQEQCYSGVCDQGKCVNTPCQGVTCIDPPAASCRESDRTIYAPSGYCSGGECTYASKTRTCEYSCDFGTCTESPCAEVFCLKPPAPYCEDISNLVVFEPEGRCVVGDSTTDCRYEAQRLSCSYGCEDGRCAQNPCTGVRCATPPARYCDGAVLVVFEPRGICHEGVCYYAVQRFPCIEPCVDASCGEHDACTWIICDDPPASYCQEDSVLRVYEREGSCEDGFCSYKFIDKLCEKGCEEGRCRGSLCQEVRCDKPPASHCDKGLLVEFVQEGTCDDGVCNYPKKETPCQDGCENARCLTGSDTATETNMDTDTHTDTDTDTETNTDCINGAKKSGKAEIVWVTICGGTFNMGSTTGDSTEQPVHRVTVKTFEMLETEVTVAQYGACVTAGSCTEPGSGEPEDNWGVAGRENHPVNTVDWNQAVAFCAWAGGRLPSEAEWEFAASNGSSENVYPWGDETATCSYAVMDNGEAGCGMKHTWAVCSKTAGNTSHGLCDMAGNVNEWLQDWFHLSYTDAPDDGSAWEDPIGAFRVVRGGAFVTTVDYLRAAVRAFVPPGIQFNAVGLRCAR